AWPVPVLSYSGEIRLRTQTRAESRPAPARARSAEPAAEWVRRPRAPPGRRSGAARPRSSPERACDADDMATRYTSRPDYETFLRNVRFRVAPTPPPCRPRGLRAPVQPSRVISSA